MRLRGVAQRILLVDFDRDAAFLDEREQLGGTGFERRALADEILECRSRHIQRAAPHQLVQTERLDLARRVTEADEIYSRLERRESGRRGFFRPEISSSALSWHGLHI